MLSLLRRRGTTAPGPGLTAAECDRLRRLIRAEMRRVGTGRWLVMVPPVTGDPAADLAMLDAIERKLRRLEVHTPES